MGKIGQSKSKLGKLITIATIQSLAKEIEKPGKAALPLRLKEIDRHLDIIRNKGRQVFLNSPPANFSRILHDYSNEQKGFVIWKDLLEERLA